ncbi:MAG: M14 family metallopeptidase [Acidobacteriota bacterium]
MQFAAALLLLISATFSLALAGEIPSPSQFLGMTIGADRTVADYRQVSAYFRALDEASARVEVVSLGQTTLGNEMIMAIISTPENLARKDRYKEIARKLSDPRGLAPVEIEALVKEGRAIVLVTCNIHSTEIGSNQMSMEWAYDLARTEDPALVRQLDEAILLLVPSLNPDGQIMEVEWYRKNLGTKYEGGRMPWLYHHYVGHDNNRDWFMLTQKETIAMNRAIFHDWFPQVWIDEHQMGPTGPRMFVPPYSNPAAPAVHPLVWRTIDHLGSLMSLRFEQQGKRGVAYGTIFDAYWPGGSKNTAWWKNTVGLLTEAASCRFATPLKIEESELSAGYKGLVDYKLQLNFPNPWTGGIWHLRDIMDYQRTASDAFLEGCMRLREDLLRDRAKMALEAVAQGTPETFYRIPGAQRDPLAAARLAHLLQENGAEVMVSPDGDHLVPTAQPMGRFVKEMMEPQRYPEVRPAAGSPVLQPYDVTAWTLPMMMGVEAEKTRLTQPAGLRALTASDWPAGGVTGGQAEVYALERTSNAASRLLNRVLLDRGSAKIALESFECVGRRFEEGTIILDRSEHVERSARELHLTLTALTERPKVRMATQKPVRIGLYKPWLASMDEGWIRFVLDEHEFKPVGIDNKRVIAGKLRKDFDAIILPNIRKSVLIDGKPKREDDPMRYLYFEEFPPEYAGGIGKDGLAALKTFVDEGGTLIVDEAACEPIVEELALPVIDTLAQAKDAEFSCPGSILNVTVHPHPVTWGMPKSGYAFLDDRMAFRSIPTGPAFQRAALVSYPEDQEDILASGWIRGAEQLERRAAAVALQAGKGKIVLFGFPVHYRAQMESTFKLLFNAVYWAGLE